jgi:hypothetical protein
LGSTDFHTREQGLQALSRWLTHKPLISELDMLKLWKGIYFCFWHSDKEPVQVGGMVHLMCMCRHGSHRTFCSQHGACLCLGSCASTADGWGC